MRALASSSQELLRPKMPELDCLRGIAVLVVLFYHGLFWSNSGLQGLSGFGKIAVALTSPGWLGVNLFFALSGFLITGRLLDCKFDQNYFSRFYIRRALRILPAYYALLVLLILAGSQNRTFLAFSFLYMSNLVWLLGVPMTYPVLWSLAVEEHFYIFWPFIVRRLSNRGLLQLGLAITCVVPLLRAIAASLGWTIGINTYTWFVADGLAMGAILAAYVRDRSFSRNGLTRFCTGAIVFSGALVIIGHHFDPQYPALMFALRVTKANLAFAGLLGLTLLAGTSRWASLVDRPILMFFGDISYGLYLFHMAVFNAYDSLGKRYWPGFVPFVGNFKLLAVRFVCCAIVAVAFAYCSRWYFEERFLRMKEGLFNAVRWKGVSPRRAYELSTD